MSKPDSSSHISPIQDDSSCRDDEDHDLVDGLKKLNVEKPNDEDTMECDDDDDDEDTTDDEDEDDFAPWLPGTRLESEARDYAETSLCYLNSLDKGLRYEFVQSGAYHAAGISGGPIIHCNFKAKAKDCPDAKVETFFAQLRIPSSGYPICDCCVSLGPTEELPNWRYANVRNCRYCHWSVHHPAKRCEKLLTGRKHDNASWLFGDNACSMSDDSASCDSYGEDE